MTQSERSALTVALAGFFLFAAVTTAVVTGITPGVKAQQSWRDAQQPKIAVPAQTQENMAPLLEGMGNHSFKISTKNEQAQTYFNQGLMLHYGFNHAEAIRSFQQAQKLDPNCAMAFWGEALARGPHLNAPMAASNLQPAKAAVEKAQSLASKASAREQAFIRALAFRYMENRTANRGELDRLYSDAMREVAQQYPDDPDAQALFAESLMLLSRYHYWEDDGTPNGIGEEIVTTLEQSMERQPNHPATNHFYIHTVEMRHPKRGEAAADRMRDLVPGIGHLQHMPSHIYLQIGRYADASLANEKAVAVDSAYHAQYEARGMYRISYMPHNAIYLTFSTSMEGRGEATVRAARKARELILKEPLEQQGYGSLTHGWTLPYYAMVRFGRWPEILEEPKPEPGAAMLYPTAIWHYARGMAYLRTGKPDSAEVQLARLTELATKEMADKMDVFTPATALGVLQVAAKTLTAEIAAANGDYEAVITGMREAVAIEDGFGYHEPPAWFSPSRETLGAMLLEAGQAAEAEQVYREDLQEYPNNGWSLFGLTQALEAQGKTAEAEEVRGQFQAAWARADVQLTSSRM